MTGMLVVVHKQDTAKILGVSGVIYHEEVAKVYSDGRREVVRSKPVMGRLVKSEPVFQPGRRNLGAIVPGLVWARHTLPSGRIFLEVVVHFSGGVVLTALQEPRLEPQWVDGTGWSEAEIAAETAQHHF